MTNGQILRQRPFRILSAIEMFLLLAGIVGLFGKDAVYEYGPEHMTVNYGVYMEEYGGVYVDELSGAEGTAVDFADIALPAGTYRVQLHYDTDTDYQQSCKVSNDTVGMKNIRTNGCMLFSGLNRTDFEMWLLRGSSRNAVQVNYSGTGFLVVKGLTITQTNAMNRVILFLLLCGVIVINGIYFYIQYDRANMISTKVKTVAFLLGLTIVLAAIPLSVDYMIGGGDLGYHLMRVEGIADGIRGGQFPVRISPEWQQGYGYASPIFYGETLLYPAGFLRLLGFTMTSAYRIFHFAVVVATVLIAYYCFRKIFQSAYVGVFCSMLYSLSVYRICKTYYTASWGETFGIMFLPLIFYGFWRVFTQDIEEESYRHSWLPLTLGFSGLVQSHLLTGEIVGGFTILLCIILWKKVFRRQTFLVLAKTVIYSVLLSAWFLVPFVDYMTTGDFVIHHVSGRTIQERGLYPENLLFTLYENWNDVAFDQTAMYRTQSMGVGVAPVASLLIFGWLLFKGRLKEAKKEEWSLAVIAGIFGTLAMVMSLQIFPWDRIQTLNAIAATLVSSIQFPSRFLTIANICLTAVAGYVGKYVLERRDKRIIWTFFTGMAFLITVSSIYLTNRMMDNANAIWAYNREAVGTGYISGAEYMPYGANAGRFVWHDPVCSGELAFSDYEKRSLGAGVHLDNLGGNTEQVAFSLLYYKGYHAYATDSGEEFPCYAGENFEVTVDIPPGFDGKVSVKFESPWYWRAGEIVTLMTALTMLFFSLRRRPFGRHCPMPAQQGGM